jgi:alkylation response protein AidB-like acyl-CoA dehydrogenase
MSPPDSVIELHPAPAAPPPRPDTAPRKLEPYPQDWLALARSLAAEFAPGAIQRDQTAQRPVEQIRRLRETGLVNLLYPAEIGGGGGTVRDSAYSVLEIATVDGSIGGLLAFHYYNSLIPLMLDYTGGNDAVARRAVEARWQWGNVTQYVNKAFVAEHHPDGGFTISGKKTWNTGAPLAEITTLLAVHPDRDHFFYSYIPTNRAGLTFHDDWDQIGLRGMDSGSISFDRVRIYPDEVLSWTHSPAQLSVVPMWTSFGAVYYSAVFLGAMQGALNTARQYATSQKRQSTLPGATVTADDVLVQVQFGELWLKLKAGLAYFDKTASLLQDAWENRRDLTEEDRGRVAMETLALRSFTSKNALEVTPQIFELGGGKATGAQQDFDRYFRDVRTLSSHDPAVLSMRTVGNYALTGKPAMMPSQFPPKA